jgi:hypothetical protein
MDYEAASPDEIAGALSTELRRPIAYRTVENDGAARAARTLASLI